MFVWNWTEKEFQIEIPGINNLITHNHTILYTVVCAIMSNVRGIIKYA